MSLSLKYSWFIVQLRPRIIHRLPGRMRIHIPALKKVNNDFHEIASVLLNEFKLPGHFKEVKVNYITGNILIVYQSEGITEYDVMKWIFQIKNVVESIFSKFISMDDADIKMAHIKLLDYFKAASKNGKIIDNNFLIPDEIWN